MTKLERGQMGGDKNQQVKMKPPVQRTLDSVKFAVLSEQVVERVLPITQANEKVRAKSLAKAGHHVLR